MRQIDLEARMQANRLCDLEGRRVNLVLADGSELDDVTLVSCGRSGVSSVWLDVDGMDVFFHRTQVLEVREAAQRKTA